MMHERDLLHKKAIKTNKELYWSSYKRLRNAVTAKIRKEKSTYYTTQLSADKSSKDMWRTLNKTLPKKNTTETNKSGNLTAEGLNAFFSSIARTLCSSFKNNCPPSILCPRANSSFQLQEVDASFIRRELSKLKATKATGLDGIPARLLRDASESIAMPITRIINQTFVSGTIPSDWKEAKITPIFKAGKKADMKNYRPISVLPLVSKIMEKVVQVQFVNFFNENKLLSIYQSGFRKKHSTETTAVYLVDNILDQMDKQNYTGTVFVDLKKAFDLVNHKCLLSKLDHYGIRDQSLYCMVSGLLDNPISKSSVWR
jgi:hypothetical protein